MLKYKVTYEIENIGSRFLSTKSNKFKLDCKKFL